ncbi:MAG: Mrp/NBP35 family ATP-binding protein [Myxococcales bacterium]|nr:Mrp/NBP35 family ATP-binding protein [Myxococcales bacterium]
MDEAKIREVLAGIAAPAGEGDLVAAGHVGDITIDGGEITIALRFSGLGREARHAIEDQVYDRLIVLDGIDEVLIETEVADMPAPPPEAGLSMHGGGGGAPAKPAVKPAKTALSDVKSLIAVASGKGGVGKSTVAVNLALALAHRGARVGLCDVDIYGPSVPVQLGVVQAKPGVSADQKRFLPVFAYGLKVMSIGFLVDDDTPVIWRGPIVSSVVKQFLDDVEWGTLDYLILDLPPGTGDAQLTLTQSAPITGAIIVTTPSELALVDAVKGLQMFRKVETPVLGMVENMSHYVCSACGHHSQPFNSGGTARVAEQLGTRILASIPLADEVQRGGDTGHPVVAENPDSPQAQAFFQLADALTEKLPFDPAPTEDKKKKGLFGLFRKQGT